MKKLTNKQLQYLETTSGILILLGILLIFGFFVGSLSFACLVIGLVLDVVGLVLGVKTHQEWEERCMGLLHKDLDEDP